MKGVDAGEVGAVLFVLLVIVVPAMGWINNIAWMFRQTEIGPVVLGLAGFCFPPLGAIHGVYLWF